MAAATRTLTSSSHTSPFSTPEPPTSVALQPASANTLAPITAASNLRASASPRSHKLSLSPRPSPQPLTGAAALLDERRRREEESRKTSPNPATEALNSLMRQGQSSAKSASAKSSETIAQMAQKISIPETALNENMQTSPVSMSSVASINGTTAATATAPTVTSGGPTSPYLPSDPNGQRPLVDPGIAGPPDSRAFTFPPPPADDPRNPHRNMSLPNPGYGVNSPKSSGAKKHKCPYCSTVFTRHHNLKSHLLTHSQEKPYECQQCQSRFRRLHDLKRHTKLHTGERPHECPKCGRKFARGDALARHNKGQGGCAGRRSSFGIDDDGEVREHMDGVEYTAEPEHMDEDDEDPERRGMSGSSRGRQDTGPYRGGPSTYPPVGPRMVDNNVAQMYPPSSRDQVSPQSHPTSLSSIQHFNGPGPGFPVTESPKPLSPGRPDPQRNSASGPSGRFQQYPGPRGSGPQLPPLPHTIPMAHGSMPPPGPGSHPGSMSSHSGGSGASTREIFGQQNGDWVAYSRDLEARMTKMQEDHLATMARMQSDHHRSINEWQAKITQLETDNKALQETHQVEIGRLNEELSSLRTKLEEKA